MSETLRAWLVAVSEPTIVIIDAIAFAWIVVGVVCLLVGALRATLSGASNQDKRLIWLGFAKVLVAALSLQLAADYFLSRDVEEIRERQRAQREPAK